MNIKNKLRFIKKLLSEILKDRIESEKLTGLIERAETIEELNGIMVNNNLTPLEKVRWVYINLGKLLFALFSSYSLFILFHFSFASSISFSFGR